MPDKPTYWEIVHAYLQEGYRAWLAGDGASAKSVEDRMGLSLEQSLDFRKHLVGLDLIALAETRDDPDFRLLPPGIAFMDGSQTLEGLLALPVKAVQEAAPTPNEAQGVLRRWRDVTIEWGLKKGLDYVWENRLALWDSLVRTGQRWVPPLPPDMSA